MTYEIYRYIFYGGAILSVIMLITSVLLFIFLKIPNVIGDLTGSNARKAIENIRSQNEHMGNKVYKSSAVNRARGKLTDKITPSGRLQNSKDGAGAMRTEKISTINLAEDEKNQAEETTVLNSSETTVLSENYSASETTVLGQSEFGSPVFEIEYEITYIHTDEAIT